MIITDKKDIAVKIQEMADAQSDIYSMCIKSGTVNYSICQGNLFLEWFEDETVSVDNDGCFNGKFNINEINLIKVNSDGITIEVGY